MVVHHPRGLHKRVADRGADEFEPACLQIGAHGIRLQAPGRDIAHGTPAIDSRLSPDERPKVAGEPTFSLQRKKGARIGNGRGNLEPVAHNSRIGQQPPNFRGTVRANFSRIKAVKSATVAFALCKHDGPA